ncbi:hypothetical protein JM79_2123 [Gramella sp. Hel_I_59]|uniref:hypothetical protein n=1 Tax=Gramella sp. Hel_I_59 TaxID=1249978 RepID=UPI001152E5D5|nr:hypothetical protein [Gramella sp. Hel_I_59]TQI71196.1 hypothetical protein JM79_2123 [Gramella sp. Hel_I_59]
MEIQRRIDNPKKIDQKLIESHLKEGDHVFIQFSDEIYSKKILSKLNKLCSKYDKNFSIRFYGHYSKIFDCDIVKNIPNVKSLYIDCIIKGKNLNQVSNLKNLERLSLGIYELEETEILDSKNFKNLTDLIIGDTKTKVLNLEYLIEYEKLKFLIISGHTKNIEKVKYLNNLTYLSLNSISKVKLDFINSLINLKTLKIILGGRENLEEIEENNIEELEIIRVRGFNSFENVSKFKKLKSLLIEDQIKLKELHFHTSLEYLKNFKLINCKSFTKLSGLINLKSLEQLRIYKTNVNFDNFIMQPLPESLNVLAFYTSKAKIDKEIKNRLQNLNYKEH